MNIIILDAIVLTLLIKLKAYDKLSMILLLPYFLWILFVTALNFEIARLNP
jgi:tryptophan-rich sensory protein